MKKIIIEINEHALEAQLYDTPTAQKILNNLPLDGYANVWGKEIYFTIPVGISEEPDAHEIVEAGELGYWPVAAAFCIFFGPTPMSIGLKPRAYSPVNIFGKVCGDLTPFGEVKQDDKIYVRSL
ncbi:MAG: hypothetical protein JXB24_15245 [Bacteroidales bacterium]|nr:hypothetical protein [Bacteroidales bacterium]